MAGNGIGGSKQTKNKQTVIFVVAVVGLLAMILIGLVISDGGQQQANPFDKEEETRVDSIANVSAVSLEDEWIARSEEELSTLQEEKKRGEDERKVLLERLEALEKRLQEGGIGAGGYKGNKAYAEQPENPRETQEKIGSTLAEESLPPPPRNSRFQPGSDSLASGGAAGGSGNTSIMEVNLAQENSGRKKERNKNVESFIPAGSFARAVLLTGLDAPTGGQAKTDPMPVALRLVDHGVLPNYFDVQINACHVTGQGYGNISAERAEIRLERLSCVLVDGDVIEKKIKGFVAGEDGKPGFRGRVVSKQGSLIAKSLLAGIFSGAGESIESQYQQTSTSPLGTVSSIDPNRVGEAGAAKGLANSFEKIADFYIARANEIYPIIEVDSKRQGEIVILEGIDLGRTVIGNTRQDY